MMSDARQLLASVQRPAGEVTRRDVAHLLLTLPAVDALAALPALRRELLEARNPFSAAFWESTESVLGMIADRQATVGEVRDWLEATGTEPTAIIGLHAWEDEPARTPLAQEMHALLVAHLEQRLALGDIDPDRLVAGDREAIQSCRALQERWMTSPLPDGRVPMTELLDETDEEFFAEWDAAEQAAAEELRGILAKVGERTRPEAELRAACRALRRALARGGSRADQLRTGGGLDPRNQPSDDAELWLTLAAGVVSPVGAPSEYDVNDDLDDDLEADLEADVALIALNHEEWLDVAVAVAQGGPGTKVSAEQLASFAGGDSESDDDFDVLVGWFSTVVELWQMLGAVDDRERLTPLGWWGIPEAILRAWGTTGTSGAGPTGITGA
ncbi:MAG: hypothetical protein ABR608_15405 [Pseudonocardiaceae bacterium]